MKKNISDQTQKDQSLKNTFSVFSSKGLEAESARRGKEIVLEIQIAVGLWYLEGILVCTKILIFYLT